MSLCFLCPKEYPLRDFQNHLTNHHLIDVKNTEYRCAEEACYRTYGSFLSFRRHWLISYCNEGNCSSSKRKPFDSSNSEVTKIVQNHDDISCNNVHFEEKYNNMSSASQKKIQSKKSNYKIDDKCNTENYCQNRNRNVFENLKTIIFKEIAALNNESTLSTKQTQVFMKYTKNVLTSGYQIIEKELQTSLTSENDTNVLSSLSNLINSFCSAIDD